MLFLALIALAVLIYFAGLMWGLILFSVGFLLLFLYLFYITRNDPESDTPYSNQIPISARLRIAYADADGNATQREINVFTYDPDKGSIDARCNLRKAKRTFRLDRIVEVVDLDTGEVLNVKKLRTWLRKHKS